MSTIQFLRTKFKSLEPYMSKCTNTNFNVYGTVGNQFITGQYSSLNFLKRDLLELVGDNTRVWLSIKGIGNGYAVVDNRLSVGVEFKGIQPTYSYLNFDDLMGANSRMYCFNLEYKPCNDGTSGTCYSSVYKGKKILDEELMIGKF